MEILFFYSVIGHALQFISFAFGSNPFFSRQFVGVDVNSKNLEFSTCFASTKYVKFTFCSVSFHITWLFKIQRFYIQR